MAGLGGGWVSEGGGAGPGAAHREGCVCGVGTGIRV